MEEAQFNQIKEYIRKIHPYTSHISRDGSDMLVILWFKELEIKNSNNSTHKIEDLIVKFNLKSIGTKYFIASFQGFRATQTEEEIAEGYSHSHLNGDTRFNTYYPFCLGECSLRKLFIENQFTINDEDDIASLLFFIEAYLKWESIEGRPYRYLDKVLDRCRRSNLGIYNNSSVSVKFTNQSPLYKEIIQLNFSLTEIPNILDNYNMFNISVEVKNLNEENSILIDVNGGKINEITLQLNNSKIKSDSYTKTEKYITLNLVNPLTNVEEPVKIYQQIKKQGFNAKTAYTKDLFQRDLRNEYLRTTNIIKDLVRQQLFQKGEALKRLKKHKEEQILFHQLNNFITD